MQGGPQILELTALSVQGRPQILAFAALSVQRDPQILEFAAFAAFPVFGPKKLNRWSAPRTRSERDQNEVLGADHRFNFFGPNTGNAAKAANSRIWGSLCTESAANARIWGRPCTESAVNSRIWGPPCTELAALSVQGRPQILAFAALSVQRDPQILEFAAFAEFPARCSKKLNRWSAPRTRSERDQNEMQVCAFWPQLKGRQEVLPKQAFKFKDMRKKAPDSSSLPHPQCSQAPESFEILEFYSIFSAMTPPNAGICSTFSAMRRPNPGICSTLSEFLQCLTATRPPHRALTAENSGFPPFWGSVCRGIHIISDCGNHFRGCEICGTTVSN